jgi:hypothetical protein
LASYTVQVTSEAAASPIITALQFELLRKDRLDGRHHGIVRTE